MRGLSCILLTLIGIYSFVPCHAFEELTAKAEKSIERGLDWLIKAQNKDGSWGLESKSSPDITCTALAGLALMAAGNTEREGPDPRGVKAMQGAVDYIMRRAKNFRSDITSGEVTLIQNKLGTRVHNFFAVVFLTQVYGMRTEGLSQENNEELRAAIDKLTELIAKSQESDGSWHKETFGSLKATCMAWLALRSAATVGLPIKHAAVEKTLKFIQKQYNANTKLYHVGGAGGYGYGDYQTLYATASSVRVLYGMGLGPEQNTNNAVDKFIEAVSTGSWKQMYLTVEGEDFLSAAMMTHALVIENGPRWKRWYPYIRDELCKRQNAEGSWTSTACINGRTFPTACALLTLETPYRYLPIQE